MTTSVLHGLPSPDAWKGLFAARGPQIATWVLGIALAAQAAVTVTGLAGADLAAPAPAEPVKAPPQLDLGALVGAHLFGEAAVAVGNDTGTAPATSMALVLAGVIANSDPKTGIAIIGDTAANAKVAMVGDTVPGGAKLNAVYPDHVLLERAGALESLQLPHQTSLAAASAPPPALPAQPPGAGDVQILDRMRKLIESDPGIVGDVMRPQPVFAEGKQRGYRVYPGRNRAAFARLGLRPGDLVTSINGTPLDDPARGNEIFRTLGSSAEARVTVMRSGRQQELTLNMAQVANEAERLGNPPALPDPAQTALGGAAATAGDDVDGNVDEPVEPPTDDRGDTG
ncbi:MAG: type II secretion system protein GspC [Steroidobacteraceae bacterium]